MSKQSEQLTPLNIVPETRKEDDEHFDLVQTWTVKQTSQIKDIIGESVVNDLNLATSGDLLAGEKASDGPEEGGGADNEDPEDPEDSIIDEQVISELVQGYSSTDQKATFVKIITKYLR